MKWFAKKVFDGGGKGLENQVKSVSYFFKFFNLVKIGKIFSGVQGKLLDRRTKKNTASRRCLVNKKLTFAAYERRASAGDILGKNQLQLAEKHNPLGEKYRVQRHAGCRTVSGEITKVVSDAQGKPSGQCTEKNTESSVTLVNEELRFAAYERRASVGGYFSEFTVSWVCEKIQNLYKKLTFERYDKIGGVGARATCVVDFCLVRFVRFLGKVGARATRVVDFCLVRFVRFLGKVGARANFRFHATAQKLCSARGFGDISRKFRAAKFVSELKSILISFNEKINLHAARGFRNVVRKFCTAHFGHYITVLFQKFPLRVANRGAILIEFAICMPILIILLFYVHDLVKIKRYYSQTEFVAQQMVNMIQNISQNRESKKVTKIDFQNITALAWLTMFSGTTRWSRPLGYWPGFAMYYVKGEENGNATCVWRVWSTYENSINPESNMHWDVGNFSYNLSSVHWKNNSSPSSIHHLLKINPGEYKIILETAICGHPNVKNTAGASSIKQKMNLYIASPKIYGSDEGFHTCFNSVVIFTPKPGLFSETAPS